MRAYLIRTSRAVEPFGDSPVDCLIANRRLAEHQEEALLDEGIDPVRVDDESRADVDDERLILDDDLYFTPELLREFVRRSRLTRGPTVCSISPGLSTTSAVVATQDVLVYPDRIEYGLRYLPAGTSGAEPMPVILQVDQFVETVRFPAHMIPGGESKVPLTDTVLIQIGHWTNLWAANMAYLLAAGARLKKAPAARLLSLALRARSTNQWRVLRQTNRIGTRCDIHPTAYIEGSEIGNNVKIGAGAIIRHSTVGTGSYVANNATVELAVVGPGSTIFNGCVVQYSALYPGSCISCRYVGLNLAGRNSFISDGVTVSDFRFDGHCVQVMKNGVRVDSGARLLGTCVGHDAYLGAGCVLSPGRAVPNGWRIVPERERVLEAFRPDGRIAGYRVVMKDDAPVWGGG